MSIIFALVGDMLQKAGAQGKDFKKRTKKFKACYTLLGIHRLFKALHSADFCCVSI